MKGLLVVLAGCALLSGCAVSPTGNSCDLGYTMSVSPQSATADSTAPVPGNMVQFMATVGPTAPAGCAVPAWLMLARATWTSSDPKDVIIDSSTAPTNGLATCVGSTNGAATLTATYTFGTTPLTQTASLTCK